MLPLYLDIIIGPEADPTNMWVGVAAIFTVLVIVTSIRRAIVRRRDDDDFEGKTK